MTIPRIIWLADISHIETPAHDGYSREEMEAARTFHVSQGLRYDNHAGITRNKNGWLSRPSGYQHDPSMHQSVESVMKWEFSPFLANSCSRVRRGYSM